MTSNTGKYPPTYGDLFPYVIERGGTYLPRPEWRFDSSGPWLVTNIDTPAGDEASSFEDSGRDQRFISYYFSSSDTLIQLATTKWQEQSTLPRDKRFTCREHL